MRQSRSMPARKFISTGRHDATLEMWPRPGAATVLFYPGTMIEPAHYQLFLFALYLCGFNVCALHLDGHGENVRNNPRTFDWLLNQGLDAEKWLITHGYGQIFVCGHSQGGIFTLAHAARSHTAAGAFAIDALFPQLPDAIDVTRFGGLAAYRNQILHITRFLAKLIPWLPVPLPIYLSGLRIIAGERKPLVTGKGRSRISYPMRFLNSLFETELPYKVNCPFWLASAENDALFTPKIIRETFAHIQAPAKKLLWLPDGGHLAILNPRLAIFTARHCACAALSLNLELVID